MTHGQINRSCKSIVIGWCTLALMVNAAAPALAAPQGAQVTHGDVNIAQSGDVTQITASNNAIINYQSFNIAAHETVRFVQPSETARVLNRVLDGNVTQINGTLAANGHVYIVNPAGIYFGGQSVVNVAAITAAAGNITDQHFLTGVDRFTGVNGAVINDGSIEGQFITLVGNHVANHGSIVAPEGMVTMAAGDSVYLSRQDSGIMVELSGGTAEPAGRHAVENTGAIAAPNGRVSMGASDVYTLAARQAGVVEAAEVSLEGPGGQVQLAGRTEATGGAVRAEADSIYHVGEIIVSDLDGSAGTVDLLASREYLGAGASAIRAIGADGGAVAILSDGRLLTSGRIDATGAAGDGGSITLVGAGVTSLLSAALDVGGTQTAGQITLGRSNDADAVAARTVVSDGSTLAADGARGGRIVLWADDAVYHYGGAHARGGDAGYIDVSSAGRVVLGPDATLDTAGGRVVLDPKNIEITLEATLGLNLVKLASGMGVTLADGDDFGSSAALNGAGDLLFVGAPFDDTGGAEYGAVYAFTLDPANLATPVFQQKIAHGTAGLNFTGRSDFGLGVAVNDAGDILLVGAQAASTSYLFSFNPASPGTEPVLRRTFIGGSDVALNAAGDIAAIGIRNNSANVYKLNTADLAQAPLASTQVVSALSEFGIAVALNGSGDLLGVGTSDNDGGTNRGTFRLYSLDPTDVAAGLTFEQSIGNGSGGAVVSDGDYFGNEGTFNDAGDRLFVGAPWAGGSGRVFVFALDPAHPAIEPTLLADFGDGDGGLMLSGGDQFGSSIAANADASLLAVGAYWDDTGGPDRGALYVIDTVASGLIGGRFEDLPDQTLLIHPTQLVALLDGNDVMLQANNDITVTDPVDASGNGGMGDLVFLAGRAIAINADLTLRGSFTANANVSIDLPLVAAYRDAGPAAIVMSEGTTIDTSAANGGIELSVGGGYGMLGGGAVGTQSEAGNIVAQNLNAGDGTIFLEHGGRTPNVGNIINGVLTTTASVNVEANGTDSSSTVINGTIDAFNFYYDGRGGPLSMTNMAAINADLVDIGFEGDFTMADGATITIDSLWLELYTLGDVTLGQINIYNAVDYGRDGVLIVTRGSILDGGDSDPLGNGGADINDFDGVTSYGASATLVGAAGVGNSDNPIEADVDDLAAITDDSDIHVNVPSLDEFLFYAGTGHVGLNSIGTITDDDGLYDIIADTADVSVGGSILDNGVSNNAPAANPHGVDFRLANAAGSTFNVSGADQSVVNAAPIDVTVSDAPSGTSAYRVSTTGTITIDAPIDTNAVFAEVGLQSNAGITVNQMIRTQNTASPIYLDSFGTITLNAMLTTAEANSLIETFSFADTTINSDGGITHGANVNRVLSVRTFSPHVATPADLIMAADAIIDGGAGDVLIDVAGDFTVGIVTTAGVGISALELMVDGKVQAAAPAGPHFVSGGDLDVVVNDGFGDNVTPIQIQVGGGLEIYNHASGQVNVLHTGDLQIDDIENGSAAGVTVTSTGKITLADDTIDVVGGTVTLLAADDIELQGIISFADDVFLNAGTDGTGDLYWSQPRVGIVADSISLLAGDGPGGGSGASVDAASFLPFFVNATIDGPPSAFLIAQDAAIDTAAHIPFYSAQFGLDGDLGNAAITLQARDGNMYFAGSNGSDPGVQLALSTLNGDITVGGATHVGSFLASANGAFIAQPDATITGDLLVYIESTGDATITGLRGNSPIATAVQVVSTGGSILDGGELSPDAAAPNGNVMMNATVDIGAVGNPIEVQVPAPDINNFVASGMVYVDFGGSDLNITTPVNVAGDNMQQVFSTAGNLFVNAAVTTSGVNSDITITAGGNATVNQAVTTTGDGSSIDISAGADAIINAALAATGAGSAITIDAGNDVSFTTSGSATTTDGQVMVTADADGTDAGGLTMAGSAFIDAGSAQIILNAFDDLVFTSLTTTGMTGADIQLISIGGAVTDNGANTASAINGGLVIEAAHGVDVITDVARVDITNTTSGDINVDESETLLVVGIRNLAPGGDIAVTDGGTLSINEADSIDNNGGTGQITLDAPLIELSAGTLDAGSGVVWLRNGGAGAFNIGGPGANVFGADLQAVAADVLRVGEATNGDLNVNENVALTGVNVLHLISGNAVSTVGANIIVDQLALTTGTGVDVDTAVGALAAVTAAGNIDIRNTGNVLIGSVDGVTGLSSPDGDINLRTFSDITGAGPVQAPVGMLDFFADGNINLSGIFNVGSNAVFGSEGGSIDVTNPANVFNGLVDFVGGEGDPFSVRFVASNPVTFDGFAADQNITIVVPTMNMTTKVESATGLVRFDGDLVLFGSDWTVNGGSVRFSGRVNSDSALTPRGLVVNTVNNGTTTFVGSVGAGPNDLVESNDMLGVAGDDLPLSHLETNADGTVVFFGPVIVLNGSSAQFDNPAQLNNDLEIVELGGGDITFGNTLDAGSGSPALTINQLDTGGGAGNVNFNNNVGSGMPLGAMTVNTGSGGQTNVGGNVTTTGAQNWNTPVNATKDVQLAGSDVNLNQGSTGNVAVVEVASADNTNLAEFIPRTGADDEGTDGAGAESELSAFLGDLGIEVPASLRDEAAPRRVQAGLDDYLLTQDLGAAFTADGFIQYLARSARHRPALRVLYDTRDTLDRIGASGLSDADKARARRRVLETMRPAGMTADEFNAVIEALPRGETVASAT